MHENIPNLLIRQTDRQAEQLSMLILGQGGTGKLTLICAITETRQAQHLGKMCHHGYCSDRYWSIHSTFVGCALYFDRLEKDNKQALLGKEIFLQFDKVVILHQQNRIKDETWTTF